MKSPLPELGWSPYVVTDWPLPGIRTMPDRGRLNGALRMWLTHATDWHSMTACWTLSPSPCRYQGSVTDTVTVAIRLCHRHCHCRYQGSVTDTVTVASGLCHRHCHCRYQGSVTDTVTVAISGAAESVSSIGGKKPAYEVQPLVSNNKRPDLLNFNSWEEFRPFGLATLPSKGRLYMAFTVHKIPRLNNDPSIGAKMFRPVAMVVSWGGF